MGCFVIRTRKNGDGTFRWYLRHQRGEDGKTHEASVPKDTYHTLGFSEAMSVMEAKARAKRLNKEGNIDKHGKHVRASKRVKNELLIDETYFPEEWIEEFKEYLEERTHGTNYRFGRVLSHFSAAQRLVKDLKLTPDKYAYRSSKVYKWFISQQYSPDYTQSILRTLNMWGKFVAFKQGTYFEPVATPRGIILASLKSSYKKKKGKRTASEPLTPSILATIKGNVKEEHYNWLYLSLWLGLRPIEVDQLHDTTMYSIGVEGGVTVLSVYQTKLVELSEEDRLKYIPIIYAEQQEVLSILNHRSFTRPHSKIVKRVTKRNHTLYAGRKGFTDLMLSKGQELEDISVWLGHRSIERTWKHYKDKKQVRFKKTPGTLKSV